jgi:hypothetical protein
MQSTMTAGRLLPFETCLPLWSSVIPSWIEEVARWNDFGLLALRGNARIKLRSEVPVRPRSSAIVVLIGLSVVGCSGSDAGSGRSAGGSPGLSGSGGAISSNGGVATVGGNAANGGSSASEGGAPSNGGSNASGGKTSATGGSSATQGGSENAGGAAPASGGSPQATGGKATGGAANGGATTSVGGASSNGGSNLGGAATGGSSAAGGSATGGKAAAGGAATGGTALGGKAATGGATATGGVATGGSTAANCSGPSLTGGTQTCSTNQTGSVGSYGWSIWSTQSGGCITPYGGGTSAFKAVWNNAGDFLAREGCSWNATKTYDQYGDITADYAYTKSGNAGGYSYIGIYGWSENPLHEFYVVDDWFGSGPPTAGGTLVDTFTVDGGTYKIYTHTQTNQASIIGTATFVQYFSIRQTARQCGHIDVTAHFKKWASLGMTLGNMYEAKLLIEAGGGSGNIDFTSGTMACN